MFCRATIRLGIGPHSSFYSNSITNPFIMVSPPSRCDGTLKPMSDETVSVTGLPLTENRCALSSLSDAAGFR